MTGLQSDDYGYGQTGVIMAELLDLPHATIVIELDAAADKLRVKRELESGWYQWYEDAASGAAHDPIGNQPDSLCDVEGNHGGEEERD